MITALEINGRKIMIMTIQEPDGIIIELTGTENWEPIGVPETTFDSTRTEEVYHRALRIEADSKGQLVRQYCSNPELSPQAKIIKINEGRQK